MRVTTLDELIMLPAGAVLRGTRWHDEFYLKTGEVEFATFGEPTPYRASEVASRGPFEVLDTEG